MAYGTRSMNVPCGRENMLTNKNEKLREKSGNGVEFSNFLGLPPVTHVHQGHSSYTSPYRAKRSIYDVMGTVLIQSTLIRHNPMGGQIWHFQETLEGHSQRVGGSWRYDKGG